MSGVQSRLFQGNAGPVEDGGDRSGVFVRVAVERGIDAERGAEGLTYRCSGPTPVVGERVEVPLGRGQKLAAGIVVSVGGAELLEGLAALRVKDVAVRRGAVLPEKLVELAQWMAGYYVCPLGMVLATMMPAAVKHGTGRRAVEVVSPSLNASADAEASLKPGSRKLLAKIRQFPPGTFPIAMKELAGLLGLRAVTTLRNLVTAGVLEVSITEEVHSRNAAIPGSAGPADRAVVLTAEQAQAVGGVARTLGGFHVHLLRGVTGSGKTEVYLRLIAEVIGAGSGTIVLVPEIALTPQTAERFVGRFGRDLVAVLHSGLTAAQRHREWARVASGEAQVVVGARSAVFAPVARLGLIVVDEEHDSSYKQDRLPRYNARDVAIKRAQLEGCPALLGSATPSLESWSNAAGSQSWWSLWELASRVGGASLPQVQIVDMGMERRERARSAGGDDGRLHLLGPTLEDAIARTLGGSGEDGGQVILLLNRRGFAHYVSCPKAACGFVLGCDQCDSTLVLHRHSGVPAGELVRCHHCLSEQMVPRLCPACGTKLNVFGGGTQRAEDELVRKFASMGLVEGETMLRLDSDSMRSARDYYDALGAFAAGRVRLLVGTQMIAKGLDFPNVRLVGVIDADTSLNIPDFRAAERTFQLVSQVAGRAGRGEKPGTVIIQTMNPLSRPIVLASHHDFVTFANEEMAIRGRARLPPVSRMARVVCRDQKEPTARSTAVQLADFLRGAAGDQAVVRGPAPCAVSRVAGQYRYGLDVIAPRAGAVQQVLGAARAAGMLKSDSKTSVDVDPVALM